MEKSEELRGATMNNSTPIVGPGPTETASAVEQQNLEQSKESSRRAQDDEIVRIGDQDKSEKDKTVTSQSVGIAGQFFSIFFSGSIEHGHFDRGVNDVYCKYSIVYGTDWMLTTGMDVGISQISRGRVTGEAQNQFVWNLPIDISFRSYNPFGWPQLVLSVYYFDTFGQDVILGYGCMHLPVTNQCPTMYKRKIMIFAPESSSYLRKFFSWLTGRKPELINSKLFANGDCREALHMVSVGYVEVVLNATFKDMTKHGFRY